MSSTVIDSVTSSTSGSSGDTQIELDLSRVTGSKGNDIDLESDEEEVSLEDPPVGIPDPSKDSTSTSGIDLPKLPNWIRSELLVIPVLMAWTVLFGAVGDFIFSHAMFDTPVVWISIAIFPIITVLWCIWQAIASYTQGKSLRIVMWLSIVHVFASVAWLVVAALWHYWFSAAAAAIIIILQISYIVLALRRVSISQTTEHHSFCF